MCDAEKHGQHRKERWAAPPDGKGKLEVYGQARHGGDQDISASIQVSSLIEAKVFKNLATGVLY